MHWILWLILAIVGLFAVYFIILFVLKFMDNMRYGQGLLSSAGSAFSDCCASIKSAIRN